MNLGSTRTVEPLHLTADVDFNQEDLEAAFAEQLDPDEELFYDAFGPNWESLPVSEKLSVMSRIAKLAEDAAFATVLNLSAGSPEPKE